MNKNIVRIMSVILALTLTAGSFTSGQAKAQPAPLMSEGLINLAHFYKPPSSTDAPTLASKIRSVVLTGGDEVFRDKLIANGFTSTIPQYFMFLGIQDPGDCTSSTRNNQAAYKAGDFCDISQNHPDWFLLDANGQRIRMSPGSDVYRMDPGNPEWRNYFVTRVLEWQSRTGWTGLFLDCLESSLGELQRNGTLPAKYPDDASYRGAIIGFLEHLNVNYSRPYNRPVIANITQGVDEATWSGYMQYLDGAMQERWAVGWSLNEYVTESKWKADLARAEKFQSQGKYLILVAPGAQSDANRQNFAFASYLLISNGKAAFRYSNSDIYREVWLYNNYQIDLGTPLGPRYQSGSLWRRDFTKGFVTVDPVNHTATISTGALPASTPTGAASPTPIAPTLTPTKIASTATATVIAPTATSVQPTSTALPPTPIPVQPTLTVLPTNTAVVQPTATAGSSTEKTYDDKNPLFVYSTGWQDVSTSSAYNGSYKETTRSGATAKFPFTGQSFSILYKGGPYFNAVEVYVDGVLVGTINQKLSTAAFQQRWDYPGQLTLGKHTLKLVFKAASGGVSRGSVDAVIVR